MLKVGVTEILWTWLVDFTWVIDLEDVLIMIKFWELSSTASLFLLKSVVDFIRLAVRSLPALPDRPVVNVRAEALQATLVTITEHIRTLDWQIAFKDVKIVAKVAQVDGP